MILLSSLSNFNCPFILFKLYSIKDYSVEMHLREIRARRWHCPNVTKQRFILLGAIHFIDTI